MKEEGMIPVRCPQAAKKYNGKRVRFHRMSGRRRIPVVGKFHVKLKPTRVSIEVTVSCDSVVYCGNYHLSQEAVDSIREVDSSDVDFELTLPAILFPRHQ
jgi:hypothetical protein